jgi:hypothetical protein
LEVVLGLVVVMVGQISSMMKSRELFGLLLGLLKVVGVWKDLEKKRVYMVEVDLVNQFLRKSGLRDQVEVVVVLFVYCLNC